MEDKQLISQYLKKIKEIAAALDRKITLMEICGGHTNVIMKYGIRDILPSNVRLISGPGCPVCVSAQKDIDSIIELAFKGIPVATYGDMLKVPGTRYSLEEAKAKTGKVFEVYSTTEVLKLKKTFPDIVFFGVGFETTAPMTCFLLENNITVYSVHKIIPPALKVLAYSKDMKIDGFIDPGHVSTIIGVKPYREILIPQVISGFTPERILRSISILLELIKENRPIVINGYPEAVKEEGNLTAQGILNKYFMISDSEWRGIGVIPGSGLEVRNDKNNAKIKYKHILESVKPGKEKKCTVCMEDSCTEHPEPSCRCGEILLGIIEPRDCSLYKKNCTPENPLGACMVSEEGSCSIAYRYGK